MPHNTLKTTLQSKWKPEYQKHGIAAAVRKHFDAALDMSEALETKRAAIMADANLSDVGRTTKIREVAAAEAPRLVKAQRAFEHAKAIVRQQRLALTPAVKDKTNLADAMLRQEIRSMLRGKDENEAFAFAMAPDAEPIVLEAIFEMPTTLSNITQEKRDLLLAEVVKRTAGPQLVALAEQDDAISLLQGAIAAAAEPLREAADVPKQLFEQWLTETVPPDPDAIAAEAASLKSAAVSIDANGLPFAERKSLIDQLLATNTAEINGVAA